MFKHLTSPQSDSDQTMDVPDVNLDDSSVVNVSTNTNDWPDEFMNVEYSSHIENISDNSDYKPRIVQVTNFQETSVDDMEFNYDRVTQNIKKEIESDTDEDTEEFSISYVCEKSLFTRSVKRRLPWEVDQTDGDEHIDQDEDIVPMSEYEESEMLGKLKIIMDCDDGNQLIEIPMWVRQFYRKLCVRQLKRSLAKPIFDIDNLISNKVNSNSQILDRYHLLIGSSGQKKTFYSTLAGSMEYEMFESPHTGRILHPFIFRNSKSIPQWVKVS